MFAVFEQVLLLLLFAAIGFTLCKTRLVDTKMTKVLSTVGVYVFLPATIFRSFSTKCTPAYLAEKYPLMLVSAGVLAVVAASAFFLSRIMSKKKYEQGLYHYSLTISNYAYVGYALTESLFGTAALLDVLIFCLPMSLYTNVIGYCTLTKQKITFKKILNPPVLAALLGVVFGLLEIPLPQVLNTLIANAAGCMSPVCMLLTGMVISQYPLKSLFTVKMTYLTVAMRLIVIPAAVGLTLRLLGLEFALLPALIAYAMPCGMNTIVFPRLVGEDCKPGASLLFISSLACCITIPILFALFSV